jgi:hypothetical protein
MTCLGKRTVVWDVIRDKNNSVVAEPTRRRLRMPAEAFAEAIVDAPLDDPELSSTARQRAAIAAVELLYPEVTATLDVELPEDEQGARAMSWQDMQALASRLMGTGEVPELPESQ